jgi:hypothetical protein
LKLPVLFLCEKQRMRLTEAGCARLWRAAQEKRPEAWEAKYHCFTCRIGAANAGETMSDTVEETEALRSICPRCRRRSDRIIAGHLCISCYNRQREVNTGRNRKGTRPRLTDVLHTETFAIVTAEGITVAKAAAVTGVLEAIIACARAATGPVAFTSAPVSTL